MKQVVSLHIGSGGINAGKAYWNQKCLENGIGKDGILDKKKTAEPNSIGAYFVEQNPGKYIARATFVDFDSNSVDEIKNFEMKDLVDHHLLFQYQGGCPTFAHSHYTNGAEKVDEILNAFSTELEACDAVDAIQIFSSYYGGVASGLGSLLASKITELGVGSTLIGLNELPSPNFNKNVIENYNTVLAIGW